MIAMPEGASVYQVPISFGGSGAGTAPLTWGQKAILKDMEETGWTHNVSGALPLDPDVEIDTVVAQYHRFMSGYPALRLRMGTDGAGQMCQVISESGDTVLDVFDVDDDVNPHQFTYDLWFQRLLTPFDHHRDWAMRMAVVRHKGVPLWRAWTLSHFAVDGGSVALLMGDLGIGDAVSRGDPRTVGLLDLARREQTEPVRRISTNAMRYWESQLRGVRSLTFGEPTHPEGRLGSRYWHGRFHSPAAYLAMLAIAARTRTDTSRVLLAIIATAIGRATGVSPLTAKVIVSNRFRPGFAEAIAPLSQNSVVTIDTAGVTIDEVVSRARRASIVAAKNAYYDPDELDELMARLDRERGFPARVSCRINDRRMTTRRVADEAARDCHVTMEQIQKVVEDSWIVWDGPLDHLPEQAFITVEDNAESIDLQLIWDMTCFTEAEVEALLREIEEVAIEAAFDPDAQTSVAPTRT